MKKMSQKPMTTVVEIQATSMLMESNEARATVQNYNWNEYSEE